MVGGMTEKKLDEMGEFVASPLTWPEARSYHEP
jgi:hypothetical protein